MAKIKLGSRFGGLNTLLDMKKAFKDAQAQRGWEAEKLMYQHRSRMAQQKAQQEGAMQRTLIGAGYEPKTVGERLAVGGMEFTPPDFDMEPKDIGGGWQALNVPGKGMRVMREYQGENFNRAFGQLHKSFYDYGWNEKKALEAWPEIARMNNLDPASINIAQIIGAAKKGKGGLKRNLKRMLMKAAANAVGGSVGGAVGSAIAERRPKLRSRAKTPGKIQGEAPAIAEVMSVYNKAAKGNKKALAQIREWLSAGYLVTDETGNLKGNPDIYGG